MFRPSVPTAFLRPRFAADTALAAAVILTVAAALLPLPAALVDAMIVTNLAASLLMLLVAITVPDPTRISVLPTLLLLATLYRISLNIATTRLVLLEADAGRLVAAFGQSMAGGSLAVGFVVFLVLTIVQFIVVARGAERVAEVAARFSLDALPGKQLAVDGDLRSGAIGMEEAQQRRRELDRQAHLYGALDGAMKFVKGDAIAGLVIIVINVVGGFAVGLTHLGLTIGEALGRYTILSIGDGLASQIPSLLVATTAGIVITRVPGDAEESVARSLGRDLLGQRRPLVATAVVCTIASLLPALPAWPCLGVAIACLAACARPGRIDKSPGQTARVVGSLTTVAPVMIGVCGDPPEDLAPLLDDVWTRVARSLGIRLPGRSITELPSDSPSAIEVHVGGLIAGACDAPRLADWVDASAADLCGYGIDGITSAHPHDGREIVWVEPAVGARARQVGCEVASRGQFLAACVESALRRHAAEFVGVQELRDLADALETSHPALVAEVLPRVVSLAQLTELARALVREEIPIGDGRALFEAVAACGAAERDPAGLSERVRPYLRRQITAVVAGSGAVLPVFTIAPGLEDRLRDSLGIGDPEGGVVFDPEIITDLSTTVRELVHGRRDRSASRLVLLASADVRRVVRMLLEDEFPWLPVVSPRDLVGSVVVQPMGSVG